MTTYTRRGPGQSYLKTVLANRINSLIEIRDLDLEINPLKVYETMIATHALKGLVAIFNIFLTRNVICVRTSQVMAAWWHIDVGPSLRKD